MLTIKNYEKLNRRYVEDDWLVTKTEEGDHNNTYIIGLE